MRVGAFMLLLLATAGACGGEDRQPGGGETPGPGVATMEEGAATTPAEGETAGEGEGEPAPAGSGPGSSGALPDAPGATVAAGGGAIGAEVLPLRPHRYAVSAAISLGNGHGAAVSSDGTVSLFDLSSGRPRAARRLFRRAEEPSLWANPAGTVLLAEGFDAGSGELYRVVWDLRSDTWRAVESPYRMEGGDADVSPDGERVAFLIEDPTDRLVIEPVGGGRGRTVVLEGGNPSLLGFDPAGRVLALCTDRALELRDARTGAIRGEPLVVEEVRATVFRPTGGTLAFRAGDAVLVVDTRTGSIAGEARHDGFTPYDVQFSGDGERLVLVDAQGNLRIHAAADLSQVRTATLGGDCIWLDARPDPPVCYRHALRRTTEGGDGTEGPGAVIGLGTVADGERVFVEQESGVALWDPRQDRARPVARQGRGERSVWSFVRRGGSLVLAGREWEETFGDAPASPDDSATPAAGGEPVFPSPAEEGETVHFLTESDDGRRRAVATPPESGDGPFRHFLLVAGQSEAIELRVPARGVARTCYEDYDGGSEYPCAASAVFSPNGETLALSGDDAAWLFGADGRPGGRLHAGAITFAPDGSALTVLQENGTLTLHDATGRARGTLLSPSTRTTSAVLTFGGPWLLALRGSTLVVADVATGEVRHRITLPGRPVGAATLVDGGAVARVRLPDGFVFHRLEDGSLVRRVEVDAVRGLTEDQSRVALCIDGRLHARAMTSEDPGRPLGPCPPVAVDLDDGFVWWHEGTTGTIVRVADGERLTVRVLMLRRPVRIAYSDEGHVQTDTHALGELIYRAPGPLLTAPLSRLEASRLSPTLVADFLAGRPLGPVPR